MDTYKTKQKDIKRDWHLIDVKDQVLGRIATKIAQKLVGKTKPYFTPHLDCGDYVVVINSNHVKVTGRKEKNKIYHHHTNFPSGLKSIPFDRQMEKDSRRIITRAVSSMLPKNKLRALRLKRLKIFKTDKHIYADKLKKSLTPGVKKGATLTGGAKPEGVTLKKSLKKQKQTKKDK